ncbi:hypothetical protein GCM10025867_39880 [Frondihabitans sucicola]|uniref:Uncharacterized protein n=1 Tax=Frondihabitans sucicola TaxID=1268041 RepID=A0ABM8GTF8_9MICO|nr:hypothetical protein [Frondihabitans sucicola]BDZ51747.1 hypothetical protein GCM10025867_39880 [Frondihabitans sucicola]
MSGDEHEIAVLEGAVLTCTCGHVVTATSPWAALMAGSQHAQQAEDKDAPEVLEHRGGEDQNSNCQEEVMTSIHDSTSATASVLSIPCSKPGCIGGTRFHEGPHEPLHSTEGTTADDGTWSVQSHSVGSGEWRTHTEAPEDQAPDETEALVVAMLDESMQVRGLNEAIRGESTRQPVPLPRNRVSAQLSTSSVNILSCRHPTETDTIVTLMQTRNDVVSLLPSEGRLLAVALLRNVQEVEHRSALSNGTGARPKLGWS